jgi:hypothetical protein
LYFTFSMGEGLDKAKVRYIKVLLFLEIRSDYIAPLLSYEELHNC